ncbi:hypothetical protein [Agromyces humi]|uniref:hypothetical protein n=1 Tax=Agromyces humi TaxID=1766800 RepID=UPI00135911C8|nr:hypothetical protein [Agromyces humi]
MQKNPMWEDELDAAGSVPLESNALRSELRDGRMVRVVAPGGLRTIIGKVTEVKVDAVRVREFKVAGITVDTRWAVYSTDATVEVVPAPVELSKEEVRDLIADMQSDPAVGAARLAAVGLLRLCVRTIGFDPTIGRSEATYGGKSADGWMREHFAVSKVKRAIDELVDAGVLRKVRIGTYRDKSVDTKYVSFLGCKAGWVTSDGYSERVAAVRDAAEDARRAKLRVQAQLTVAERHADEVEAEFQRLLRG